MEYGVCKDEREGACKVGKEDGWWWQVANIVHSLLRNSYNKSLLAIP